MTEEKEQKEKEEYDDEEDENITLLLEEIYPSIPKQLEDKHILIKMEEGTSTKSECAKPGTNKKLENYINLKSDININYDSEDEHLLHLMDQLQVKEDEGLMSGSFPSLRKYYFSSQYKNEDNIFFTSLIKLFWKGIPS